MFVSVCEYSIIKRYKGKKVHSFCGDMQCIYYFFKMKEFVVI